MNSWSKLELSINEAPGCAAKRVSTYLCEGSTINTGDDPHVIAHATAYAFAEAVAHASIDCQITGVGSVKAQAHAKAEKKAKVWLKAWAQAVSVAEVCEKCFTYATATVDILEKVLLHAVAEVYISVDEKNDNPNTYAIPCCFSLTKLKARRKTWCQTVQFVVFVRSHCQVCLT